MRTDWRIAALELLALRAHLVLCLGLLVLGLVLPIAYADGEVGTSRRCA